MTLFQILPLLAYAAAGVFVISRAFAGDGQPAPGTWRWPALLFAVFAAFTIWQLSADGVLMFWVNHTSNATGNQVWLDLLLSVSIAFAFLVPAARRLGMPILPWAIFVIATASVGLLAMWARVLFLQERSGAVKEG